MKFRAMVSSILILLAFACSLSAAERRFSGRYTVGFETSEFIPCGKEERWWLEGNLSALNAKLEKKPRGTMQTLFVRLTGTASPAGRYGHLGRYQRKFTVTRVILARSPQPGDCK